MQNTITPEEIILYIYDELNNPIRENEISEALKSDNELFTDFIQCATISNILKTPEHSPSEMVCNNLINYSKALFIEENRFTGKVISILN